MSSTAKNSILKKIRAALTHTTPLPFPQSEGASSVFQPLQQDIVIEFAEQFTTLQGKFLFCADKAEAIHALHQLLKQTEWSKVFCTYKEWAAAIPPKIWTDDISTCDASITGCEALVARTGSILLSTNNSGRINSVYAPVHICIAYASQLVYDIKDGLELLKHKYPSGLPSFITLATGPSRTADIEKTLVVGVHGPKEVYLFLIDDLAQA
jgi:L-lactate dehydrogenase complex protein LldG